MRNQSTRRAGLTMLICILFALSSVLAFGHGGRTDSNGGHKDNKNASGLGSYHYHHGQPAHLHPNGVCPYNGSSSTSTTQTSQPKKHNCAVASNKVCINGQNINKTTAQYPPLLYKDITYIPLTSDILNFLNITYVWNDPDNLIITKNGAAASTFTPEFQAGNVYQGMGVSIKEVDKGVIVNGVQVSHQYPVITYNDIYYLPLTTEIMEALGFKGGWTPEDGFTLVAS